MEDRNAGRLQALRKQTTCNLHHQVQLGFETLKTSPGSFSQDAAAPADASVGLQSAL
jgi:hypothetical protein